MADMEPDAQESDARLLDLRCRWSSPTLKHRHDDLQLLCSAVEVAKAFLRQDAEKFVRDLEGRPVLLQYSGDGTPIKSKCSITARSGEESLRRSGRRTSEYYVQNCFLVAFDAFGVRQSKVLLEDPRPMTEGKRCASELAFGLQLLPRLRALGHRGIEIFSMSWDRAKFEALSRTFRQWQNRELAQAVDEEGFPAKLQLLLTWTVCVPCSLHDTHNALKWSMGPRLRSPELLKDLYIVLASISNSYKQIVDRLSSWLSSHLRFREADALPEPEALQELWVSLGADPFVVGEIMDLRLIYEDGCLWTIQVDNDIRAIVHRVVFILLSLWRFTQYSEGRWVSIGDSCRSLVAGMLTGLPSLIAEVIEDEAESNFHINGFTRLQEEMKQFVVIVAFASYPSDTALRMLLGNGRFLKIAGDLNASLDEEVGYLAGLRAFTWSSLGDVCGLPGPVVQSEVLSVAHVCISFMGHRFLDRVNELPFSLCQGDISTNINQLVENDMPEEPVSAKLWMLIKVYNFNRSCIERALSLLAEATWQTGAAEQQHASGTIISRYHPEIEQEAMMVRAAMHTLRHLLPQELPEEVRVRRLTQKLEWLQRRHPRKCSPRQIILKDSIEVSTKWELTGRIENNAGVQAKFMKYGNQVWKTTPASERRSCLLRSLKHIYKKEAEISEQIDEVMGELHIARNQLEEELRHQGAISLKACKWSAGDLERLETLWTHGRPAGAYVLELRHRVKQAPLPLAASLMKELFTIHVWKPSHDVERPPWVSQLARCRDLLVGSILVIVLGGHKRFFKFMFAMQNPIFIRFSEVVEHDSHLPMVEINHDNWDHVVVDNWANTFRVDFSKHCAWHELPSTNIDDIFLIASSIYRGGAECVTAFAMRPLSSFIADLPAIPSTSEAASSHANFTTKAKVELTHQFPWLAGSIEREAYPKKRLREEGHKSEAESDNEVWLMSDDQIEAAFSALAVARAEAANVGDDFADWRVSVLGGAWAAKHRGSAFDAFRAAPCASSAAEEWAAQYGMGNSARFYVSLYGAGRAHDMARAFAHKCQFFFDLWLSKGIEAYDFTEGDYESYVEPAFFKDMELFLHGRARTRFRWLRELLLARMR